MTPAPPAPKTLRLYVDGASRGNPGPAGYGVYAEDESGRMVFEANDYIGETTNSVAEYRALLRGLEESRKRKAAALQIFTDSQLVARQFDGSYRVKHASMQELMAQVRELEKAFDSVSVQHIPRASHPGNRRADKLANIAINRFGPQKQTSAL